MRGREGLAFSQGAEDQGDIMTRFTRGLAVAAALGALCALPSTALGQSAGDKDVAEAAFAQKAFDINKAATRPAEDAACQRLGTDYHTSMRGIASELETDSYKPSRIKPYLAARPTSAYDVSTDDSNSIGNGWEETSSDLDRNWEAGGKAVNDVLDFGGGLFSKKKRKRAKKARTAVAELENRVMDAAMTAGCPMASFR